MPRTQLHWGCHHMRPLAKQTSVCKAALHTGCLQSLAGCTVVELDPVRVDMASRTALGRSISPQWHPLRIPVGLEDFPVRPQNPGVLTTPGGHSLLPNWVQEKGPDTRSQSPAPHLQSSTATTCTHSGKPSWLETLRWEDSGCPCHPGNDGQFPVQAHPWL